MYRSLASGISVTTRLPRPRRRATSSAAVTFAPAEEAPRMPSSEARRATMSKAGSSSTRMTSVASTCPAPAGMNDEAPMPSTSCGPASPPLRIEPCGSTMKHCTSGFRSRRYLRHAGERSAGAGAGYPCIDAAVHLFPDLGGRWSRSAIRCCTDWRTAAERTRLRSRAASSSALAMAAFIPPSFGVRTTSPPRAFITSRFSMEKFSGTQRMTR